MGKRKGGRQRSDERMNALSSILVDGLYYSWFRCTELDESACTATIYTDDLEGDEGNFAVKHEVGPDDIARGLRMYREYMEGKREHFKGEWEFRIKDLLRAGTIKDRSEFKPEIHCRADERSYGWQTVKFDRTNGAEGDYDANTADSVMQFALLGEVVYG